MLIIRALKSRFPLLLFLFPRRGKVKFHSPVEIFHHTFPPDRTCSGRIGTYNLLEEVYTPNNNCLTNTPPPDKTDKCGDCNRLRQRHNSTQKRERKHQRNLESLIFNVQFFNRLTVTACLIRCVTLFSPQSQSSPASTTPLPQIGICDRRPIVLIHLLYV